MIFFGTEKFIKGENTQSLLKYLVRLFVWGGMAIVALFPDLSDQLAKFIGIEDNINAVILSGFILVFLLIFKILSVVERIEQEISTLTRKQALEDLPKPIISPASLLSTKANRQKSAKERLRK